MAFKFERPAHFAPITAKFTLPNGEGAQIEATFKYRTRSEFSALLNDLFGERADLGEEIDFEKLLEHDLVGRASRFLPESITAWNVADTPVSVSAMEELADTVPAAISALWEAYRQACAEGRLGN